MADNLEEILSDPGYQGLDDTERMGIRRAFYRSKAADPGFRSLPDADKTSITRDILFPQSEQKPEPENVARPKPTMGEAITSGFKRMATPRDAGTFSGSPTSRLELLKTAGNAALGGVEMVGGLLQPVTNAITSGAESISRRLSSLPSVKVPIPTPDTEMMTDPSTQLSQEFHPADLAAGLASAVGDASVGPIMARGMNLLKSPMAAKFPTINERVGALGAKKQTALSTLEAEREQRLADVYKLSSQEQKVNAERGLAEYPKPSAARTAIKDKAAADIAQTQTDLAAAQAKVGQQAAEAAGPVGPKSTNFNKRYEGLRNKGDQVMFTPTNLNIAARKISKESGELGAPVAFPERSGGVITENLTTGGPEDIGKYIQRALREGGETKTANYGDIIKTVLTPATADNVTGRQLIDTIKRLRKSETSSYSAGHPDLGRQFHVLEKAAVEDLKADKGLTRLHRKIDKDYSKQMSTEWWADGVQNSFNDKTGGWDRGKFTKWFMAQTDTKDSDRFLKRLLGDRYDGTKALVGDMQQANVTNIEGAAKEAVRNLRRRMGTDIRAVNEQEKGLVKGINQDMQGTLKARMAQNKAVEKDIGEKAKVLEKEFAEQVEKITGTPYEGRLHKLMGSLAVVGGTGSLLAGGGMTLFGMPHGPAMMSTGLGSVAGGMFTLMTHDTFTKIVNSAKGASLLRRAVRAAPGTGEAISASAAISNFAKQLESQPSEEPAMVREATRPKAAIPSPDIETKKNNLLQKYSIPSR